MGAITDMATALAGSAGPDLETVPTSAWVGRAPMAILASREAETLRWGRRWLESFGFQVATAGSLDEAARLLATGSAEVVVVDGSVRGTGAVGAWAAIRKLTGGGELPVLTVCSNDREAGRAMLEGSTEVVRKPISWPVLSQRAARMVHAARTSKELVRAQSELATLRIDRQEEQLSSPSGSLDPLTGLPHRKSYERMLDGTLAGNARVGSALAVLYLDLDRFTLINQTYGHRGGNQILVQVAERLAGCLRRRDLLTRRVAGLSTAALGRLSGDAFSLMVSPIEGREALEPIAQAVLDALARPFALDHGEAYLSASLGIVVAPTDGGSAEDLLQHAELAMDEARRRGGSTFRFYSRAQSGARERALKIDGLLRRSMEHKDLSLVYQPIIDLPSRRIVGAEALLRWHHPELGNVPPMEFIPFAEETGLMVEIGRWVLKTACRQLKAWIDEGLPAIRMAINVSLCQLMRGNLVQVVDEALAEAGLDGSLLELELSERGVLCSDPEVLRQLQELRSRRVRVSVDDFGTGDAAIGNLKRFPLDTLKVDRSFVASALTNDDDAAITSAMIAMAHRLRLRVVAEGVEEGEQVAFLEGLECEELQGYFFSPGVPAAKFRSLLADEKGARVSAFPRAVDQGRESDEV
jgi:diguanylate cyclase (GGDEF)-like protein